jgi:hypothetical protein
MPKYLQLLIKLILLIAIGGIPYFMYLSKLITENDTFYWKSTYASPNLILGASRANQGISPDVLEAELQLEQPALNFAFTGIHSPYGEAYYKMIQRKIDYDHTPGLFILSVHPGNLADYKGGGGQRENDFRFYDLWCVNCEPNVEYILRNVSGKQSLLPVIITKIKPKRAFDIIHHNGWIERTTPPEMRLNDIDELKAMQYDPYRSASREAFLEKAVEYLVSYGKVVLVRMPVSKQAKEREDIFFDQQFDSLMQSIASRHGAHYLDYSVQGPEYEYNDGIHHLDGPSAERFSKQLARDIKNL